LICSAIPDWLLCSPWPILVQILVHCAMLGRSLHSVSILAILGWPLCNTWLVLGQLLCNLVHCYTLVPCCTILGRNTQSQYSVANTWSQYSVANTWSQYSVAVLSHNTWSQYSVANTWLWILSCQYSVANTRSQYSVTNTQFAILSCNTKLPILSCQYLVARLHNIWPTVAQCSVHVAPCTVHCCSMLSWFLCYTWWRIIEQYLAHCLLHDTWSIAVQYLVDHCTVPLLHNGFPNRAVTQQQQY